MDRNTIKKAVALKYGDKDAAPRILAAARGYLADRIIQAAEKFDIPLFYSPEVVEKLVYLDIGQEIPAELYEAVAEIYAFLVKIDAEMEIDKHE